MSGHDVSAEPRDTHGRWTDGGAGADTGNDPRVTDVGGDKWNQDTASRLESEYAAVRPAMDAIAKGAEGKTGRVENNTDNSDDEDFHAGVPESWDDMSNSQQTDAEDKYKEENYSSALESEQQSWSENGEALGQAKSDLASDADWKFEKIGEFLTNRQEEGQPRVPYTVDQLAEAIDLTFENNGSSDDEVEIAFDDSKLQEPDTAPDPAQMAFPGIDKPNLSALLPKDVRDELQAFLEKEFVSDAESRADKIEPPDYLGDSAKEYVAEMWDQMSDESKFQYAKNNDVLPEEEQAGTGPGATIVREPGTYDPLNNTNDEDYKRTQAMSHYLFDNRVQQVMAERKIGVGSTSATPAIDDIRRADRTMWTDWKGSSTSQNGQLMQVASADELGGRLRGVQRPDDATLKGEYEKYSEQWKKDYPGSEGLTFDQYKQNWATQYAPRDSGVIKTAGERVIDPNTGSVYTRLPDISVVRNGLASTTTDANVANDWGGVGNNAPAGIDREAVIAQANKDWKDVGGYDGIKAMMRAKWEATQYMLDRADQPTLEVYRGINLEHTHDFSDWRTTGSVSVDQGTDTTPGVKHPTTGEWINPGDADYPKYLDTLHTAEATVRAAAEDYQKGPHDGKDGPTFDQTYDRLLSELNPDQAKMIASKYVTMQNALRAAMPEQQKTTRVVLRAQVPRTAVLSVPAYGINVHSEKEAVVAGTAWKTWEAYSSKAPRYDQVKAHAVAATTEAVNQLSYKKYVDSFGGTKSAAMSYHDWLAVTKPEKAYSVLKKSKGTS